MLAFGNVCFGVKTFSSDDSGSLCILVSGISSVLSSTVAAAPDSASVPSASCIIDLLENISESSAAPVSPAPDFLLCAVFSPHAGPGFCSGPSSVIEPRLCTCFTPCTIPPALLPVSSSLTLPESASGSLAESISLSDSFPVLSSRFPTMGSTSMGLISMAPTSAGSVPNSGRQSVSFAGTADGGNGSSFLRRACSSMRL